MPTSKVQASHAGDGALPLLPLKTKGAAPRNPKTVGWEDRPRKMLPSEFAREMSLSTEEKLASIHVMHPPRILELLDMSETTHQKVSSVDVDQALFQAFPSEIVFQNFNPSETYQIPLTLRNIDKIPRLVKVLEEDSLYFRVVSPVDVGSKVAPGMSSIFTVHFSPQENKDYLHRVVCVTEREKFEVPIRAIGARAVLDFPDQLHFPVSPVKAVAQRTLLVRNIGNTEAKFQLHTQSPFSVAPPLGTVAVGASIQVTVDFLPKTSGDHCQDLHLRYHTGEDVYLQLYGAAADVNVRLERNSVMVGRTFLSLCNQRSVAILNRSGTLLHYRWSAFASEEDEEEFKLREHKEFHQEQEDEMENFLSECNADPASRERLTLLSRTFQERRRQLRQDQTTLLHSHITVEPLEGDIWPNSSADIDITFKPREATTYQLTLYCDITGRESRLPLRIKGEGIGPKLQANFDLLDMGNIFVGSKHSYEVLLSNQGLITAPYRVESPSSAFGRCFSFCPAEGVVPALMCHALEVCFSCSTLGNFSEEILLTVIGNPQPLTLTFSGRVMGPTFHFNTPELAFGDVSFGFPHTLTCSLSNTSLVPMAFALRVPGDGDGAPSLTSASQVADLTRADWTCSSAAGSRPQEFSISPMSGSLQPQGQVSIQVTLCSNRVRSYRLALVVDVEGVGEEVLTLPITARCVVPEVAVETSLLDYHGCFLGYPYEQMLKLINSSDLPACYGLLFQEYEERPALLYSSPQPRGVVQPGSTVEIPLVLQAQAVGRLQHAALIAVFGSRELPLEVLLSCIGKGPELLVLTTHLDFGSIPVLTDVSRTLELWNESPIPALFSAQMGRSRSLWRVEPSEGVVSPGARLELRVVAHLDDTLRFHDDLLLLVQDKPPHRISLVAKGTGTTIVTNQPFAPSLDLGAHFSSGPCQYHLTLTNRGRRSHQLYWTSKGFPVFARKGSRESRGPGPVFSIRPPRMELAPGHSADIVLEGSLDSPKLVRERLVCHAILGHQSGTECIMAVDVTCNFVAPALHISSQQLHFYLEKAPGVSLVPQYQKLTLRNVSSLPLSLELSLARPFGLCGWQNDSNPVTSKSLAMGVDAQTELWVRFDPSYREDRVSRVVEEELRLRYREHPQQDRVGLRGEVHFPNLLFSSTSLDFGCVLNHTESQRQLTMTNNSPLEVAYRWAFLVDQHRYAVRFSGQREKEGREEERDDRPDWSKKTNDDIRLDSNRKGDGSQLSLDEGEMKGADLEQDAKEGGGSPKEAPSPSSSSPPAPRSFPEGRGSPRTPSSVGVEEVFDILPIYGQLQPGASQLVTFSFYGHAHVRAEVLALCEVKEGPTYDITLKGEASLVAYSLDTTHLDLGLQLFDHVAEAEMTLSNTSRVGFQFSTLQEEVTPGDPQPGQPLILPASGYVEAGSSQTLRVCYLPGVPEVFLKSFQLQVAFYQPENISVTGKGVFPRICMDLPRHLDEDRYSEVLRRAREVLEEDRAAEESRPATAEALLEDQDYIPTYDGLLQMEVERQLLKEQAAAVWSLESTQLSCCISRWRKKLNRFILPDYLLDFGFVIHGTVPTHIVKVTNSGPMAVSFRADRHPLTATGFSTELDRVKNLPYCETETFEVKFDPRGANLDLGPVSCVLPIQVVGGPMVQVILRAVVTMPSLAVSTDTLRFDSVQCGMCQIRSVQLSNPEPVPCQWSIAEEERPRVKLDKHLPLHLRRKARLEKRPAVVFEMLPSAGLLYPGDRVNVQVKFSPVEGRAYSQRLVLCVQQSSRRAVLQVQGEGEEPRLDWSSSVLTLGPILPLSAGQGAQVLVRNPCPFPIEFYSLDFDKQYLEEEKILRVMKGYDEQNILLLPPRFAGAPLPPELLQYYREHYPDPAESALKDQASPDPAGRGEGQEGEPAVTPADQSQEEEYRGAPPCKGGTPCGAELKEDSEEGSSVGQLEDHPVSRAIARHMGIDLSPEGQATRNRRSIAIIVHGAPLSGKTAAAVALARQYGGACLSLNAVLQEAVCSGTTPTCLQARELCARAAMEHAQRRREEAAQAAGEQSAAAGLSVEAVARHTAEGSQASELQGPSSSLSTHNKNSLLGRRADGSQPTLPSLPLQRQLSASESQLAELGLLSCCLPEHILEHILAERLQLSDCHRGVVIDGLETAYGGSLSSTLQVVLKAFNNRQHIYLVDLHSSYPAFRARERAQRDAEEARLKEQADREQQLLQEMDEEEYDALPEQEKELIHRRQLAALRERRRREQEQAEGEQDERRQQQEEVDRLREEEDMKRKNKKGKKEAPKDSESPGKKSQEEGKQVQAVSQSTAVRSDTKLEQPGKDMKKMSCLEESPPEGSREGEEAQRKRRPREGKPPGGPEESPPPGDDSETEASSEELVSLQARFREYERSQPHLLHILQYWDRSQGLLAQPLLPEEAAPDTEDPAPERQPPSGKKSKKEREKVEKERERQEKEKQKADVVSPMPSQAWGDRDPVPSEVIPHLLLSVNDPEQPSIAQLVSSLKLPSVEQVLDGLGLGPSGPPIPPPTIFSVVPYPVSRGDLSAPCTCFTFLAPSCPDDSLESDRKDLDLDPEAPGSLALSKDEGMTPSKDRRKKVEVSKETVKEKTKTPAKKGGRPGESRSPPSSPVTPFSENELGSRSGGKQQEQPQGLATFRWVVPANGEVMLKIWFHSATPGQFDQTLNFELLGTKRRYQVYCRGVCAYPSISHDYRTVFANCKRVTHQEEGLQKTYVVRSGHYEFGPLLCGKTRDRYKEPKYPENMERLVIHNTSPLEAEVHFCFQHDTKASTFLLDPPLMTITPNDKQDLMVWAYPTSPGLVEDSLLCLVKGNPEPVVFHLSCHGVRPELEMEPKLLHFGKILLHSKDTRSLVLRNRTALPTSWRLSGLEVLGDEFSPSQDQGIILPQSEFSLQIHFRAMKPINLKRAIRLEVSDVENILGIVHTENIQIVAEAYDVALEINLPKGANGGLDFGTLKVSEEVKLSVNLKNKGKYENAFKFMLEATHPSQPDLNQIFTISPMKGPLYPADRPTCVQIVFRHNKEVVIKDQPILLCQVIEPNLREGGETLTSIPIKVSVQSLFSKYSILPPNNINFGPLIYGCKKTQSFTIENKGHFEIRFNISRMSKDLPVQSQRRGVAMKRSSRESHSAKPPTGNKVRRADSIQKDMTVTMQARLTVGVFTVAPGFGTLAPGGQQVVTVDCLAEQAGHWQECLAIDISDRDPADQPGGIPYHLVAEICMTGINCKDMASIFEEHHLCPTASLLQCEPFCHADGVYILDENRFVFNNVLVGRPATARFRLANTGKVPCELSLAIRSVSSKVPVRNVEVFEVTPTKVCIPSHSHIFAVVTFAPQFMQTYQAVFEASLEGATSLVPMAKSRPLVFDLMGEGNLPSVTVVRPALRTSRGEPLLQFRHLLGTHPLPSQTLLLKNDSNIPAQVHMHLLDKMGVFTLRAAPDTPGCTTSSSPLEGPTGTEGPVAHSASLRLAAGQQAEFAVGFIPTQPLQVSASIQLQVEDNQFEDTLICLQAEGYRDDITLTNISNLGRQDEEAANGSQPVLQFGDCHVGRSYQQSFTMSNLSSSHAVRFSWPSEPTQLSFSPSQGHLHAGCSKDITVTLCSQQPLQLSRALVRCSVSRLDFQQPVEQVADWDDRQRTVHWLETGREAGQKQPPKKKVVEVDPEPCCSVVENSQRDLELCVSAVCDYTRFSCSTEPIHFRDTLLYQTRVFQLPLENQGSVELEFSWQVFMDTSGKTMGFHHQGVTPAVTPGETPGPGRSSMSAPRPASALGSLSALLLGDPELPPFSVEPSSGTILPGHTHTLLIRFSPLEVAEYQARLVCRIPNLKDEPAPNIEVAGRSLLPYCHFHLEDSDYLTSHRRRPQRALYRELDPSTRTIQFTSVGLGPHVTRMFSVVNPTNKTYSFQWKCEDADPLPFRCLVPQKSIQPGKKVELGFEFVADQLETVESFWSFLIPDLSLSVPFLLVGSVSNPLVYLDQVYLNMGPLLQGCRAEHTVQLVNDEEQPFSFSVLETSCHSQGFQDSLLVQPMAGTLPPKHRMPLALSFTPSQEGLVTFNLELQIRGKVEPLRLNVKAESFTLSACVVLQGPEGDLTELVPSRTQTFNFREVELRDASSCLFLVSNHGRFNLDVEFELWGGAELRRQLRVEPERAAVEVGQQTSCTLTFSPLKTCVLKDVGLNIRVKNGAVFSVALTGSSVPPGLDFSYLKHDFGMNFIYCPGMVPPSSTLCISNKGLRAVSLDCQFQTSACLEVSFQPQVLPSGGSLQVPITFYPREARRYRESLLFTINACTKQTVEILGQGIEMKVELVDPSQRQVNLGALLVGQKSRKIIPLVNNCPSALTLTLLLHTSTPALLDARVISVSPAEEVTLAPGGRCVAEILFSPRQRVEPFRAELQAECLGVLRPLVEVTGCCQGVEVSLDQDFLPFGAVAQRCSATRRIIMTNTGDIGVRFQWDVKRFAPDFSISPAEGYLSRGQEASLLVTFAPLELSPELRYDRLPCSVEGAAPLTLTLIGSCIPPPVNKDVVLFSCQVRAQQTQSVPLSNRTTQRWCLRPTIEGEHWSGPPSLTLEPHQSTSYDITYRPLIMTADGKKHQGSVFFSFPDGTGLLYLLQGTADPPKAVSTISHELPCKTHYTQLVPVHNWLAKPQRFRALVEIMKPEKVDATVTLKGLDYVEVPALATTDYKITFFTYKEGLYSAKVTFRNEVSGEYLFYILNLRATPPGVMSTVEMTTPVRRTTSASITLDNPLPGTLSFTAECRCPDISLPPQLSVPGLAKGTLTFEYQPLRPGESSTRLVVQNSDLGFFNYELLLRALPAPPEKPLLFRAALGTAHYLSARFTNYSRVKAEYSWKTDCQDFTVEKNIHAAAGYQAGSEASLEVCFEPSRLGEVRATLTLSSAFGGEYVFPLYGTCTPPKAQGPFLIRSGSSVSIPFKNVFLQATVFSFQVDNPAFTVKGVETIRPKKTHSIQVMFDGASPGAHGKLTISSPRSEGHGQPISWVFYLRGHCPEQTQTRDKS